METDGTSHLSQLDVISCALGAAIFLSMIFSVIKERPPQQRSAPDYLYVSWLSDVENADFAFRITPPGGQERVFRPQEFFNMQLGTMQPSKAVLFPLQEYGSFTIERPAVKSFVPPKQLQELEGYKSVIGLHIAQPRAGDWKIDLIFSDKPTSETAASILDTASATASLARYWETREKADVSGLKAPIQVALAVNPPYQSPISIGKTVGSASP